MKKITKLLGFVTPALLFVLLFLSPVSAFFVQSGDTLVLPKEKKIDEAAFISGSTLTIDSNINGDLYCAGRDIIINGNVKGDISCVSQSLKINGIVDGNVRAAAQTIDITGQVTRNLVVAAQRLTLEPKSQIKGDIFFGVQNVELGGSMGRDLAGAGEAITFSGSLLRNAVVTGTSLSVIETGKIGGNLDYYMEKTASPTVDKKNVKGVITRHEITTPEKPVMDKQIKKLTWTAIVLKSIISMISFIVLGLTLVYFDRKNTEARIAKIATKPVISALLGFAALIVAPIALIILMVTVIGMPFAFVTLLVFLIALMLASLYPSALLGKLFLEKILKYKNTSLYWQMFTGVIVLGLVMCIPLIGWLVAFVAFCMGLGAYLTSLLPNA